MGRDKRNEQGGKPHFSGLIRVTMETDAWRSLSTTAQALYPWLKLEWHGPKRNNNGKLRLSVRQAAECLGCNRNTAARAFLDLQAKGFIVQTEGACLGTGGAAQSPSYELTEIALVGSNVGRRLYLNWKKGHDFPAIKSATNNPSGTNGKSTITPDNVVSLKGGKS